MQTFVRALGKVGFPMPEQVKTTYTLAEAARLLSCHPETLRRAIRDGSLRAARLGRGYRVSRLDLEAFWSASGGGDLFSKAEPEGPPSQVEAGKTAPKASPKKQEPQQLTLPT